MDQPHSSSREVRRTELERLYQTDKVKLIYLYRHAVGLNIYLSIPKGSTAEGLIETILDHEFQAAAARPANSDLSAGERPEAQAHASQED